MSKPAFEQPEPYRARSNPGAYSPSTVCAYYKNKPTQCGAFFENFLARLGCKTSMGGLGGSGFTPTRERRLVGGSGLTPTRQRRVGRASNYGIGRRGSRPSKGINDGGSGSTPTNFGRRGSRPSNYFSFTAQRQSKVCHPACVTTGLVARTRSFQVKSGFLRSHERGYFRSHNQSHATALSV